MLPQRNERPDFDGLEAVNTGARYSILARLGSGGFGDVFLAVARGVGGFRKLVVIKQMKCAGDSARVGLFLDEARLAAWVHHPNVVQTNAVCADDGRYLLVMEYLDGQPLSRILRRSARSRRAFPLEMRLAVLIDMLRGLHHSHELRDLDGHLLGVVHRDVSPQNVFVTYDGQIKIMDFGIAKARGRSTETATGIIKGKIKYMSPEQSIGSDNVDRRSDVFAAGIMLYEAVTGRRYWTVDDPCEIRRRLLAGDAPRWPRAIAPEVDEQLDAICARALAPHPEQRYATAAEMADALDDYLLGAISGRPLASQIGRYLSELFAADRARMRSVVDARLALLEARFALRATPARREPTPPQLPYAADVLEAASELGRASNAPPVHRPSGTSPSRPGIDALPTTKALTARFGHAILVAASAFVFLLISEVPAGDAAASKTHALTEQRMPHAIRSAVDYVDGTLRRITAVPKAPVTWRRPPAPRTR